MLGAAPGLEGYTSKVESRTSTAWPNCMARTIESAAGVEHLWVGLDQRQTREQNIGQISWTMGQPLQGLYTKTKNPLVVWVSTESTRHITT